MVDFLSILAQHLLNFHDQDAVDHSRLQNATFLQKEKNKHWVHFFTISHSKIVLRNQFYLIQITSFFGLCLTEIVEDCVKQKLSNSIFFSWIVCACFLGRLEFLPRHYVDTLDNPHFRL